MQVEKYLEYRKLGQYGDDKQKEITFRMPNAGGPHKGDVDRQPAEMVEKVRALKEGDKVLLCCYLCLFSCLRYRP